MPFFQSDIFANTQKPNINIITLLVDKNLYKGDVKDSIDRYATQYIQKKISNSKAIIFPINTEKIKARDIVKMLENIYYDGLQKEPSTLKGVILIGDTLPLPIVNDNGAQFPTILPYTDFDNPKYYRDPQSQFFVPNNIPKAQAEIRQSIINIWPKPEDYIKFFHKLQTYYKQPKNYVSDKIWYDDFIDQKQSFNNIYINNYINKFAFAEDLAYHRYNPILVDLLNKQHNTDNQNLIQELANLTGVSGSYANQVNSVFSGLLQSTTWKNEIQEVPTVFIDDTLQWFQKSYQELYWVSSNARMRDNILSAGRWNTSQIDSHSSKIEYYDQLYTKQLWTDTVPVFVEINKALENTVVRLIKEKQYPLRIGIPLQSTIEKHVYTQWWVNNNTTQNDIKNTSITLWWWIDYYKAGIYEAFYYGKNASTISGIDQTSIFLGTPNPINNSITNLTTITNIDNNHSIWSSYWILSQFVEANRWYVTNLAQSDIEFQQKNKICGNNNESFYKYRDGYLWGNTPLNLTWWENWLELINKRYDRGGISNRIITHSPLLSQGNLFQAGSIFNIAWSKKTKTPQPWMMTNNLQWGFLQKVAFEEINNIWQKILHKVDVCDITQIDSEPLTAHDLSNITGLYQTGYFKEFLMNGVNLLTTAIPCPQPTTGTVCFPYENQPAIPQWEYIQKQQLLYKTIDSLSVHNAPTPDHISQLTTTTPDRPIDSIRYVSFKGIGWDWVRLDFPNLYNIPVYKADSNNSWLLLLQSPSELERTIRIYLTDIVSAYNNKIIEQNNKKISYFNQNISLFSKLWVIDPLATPNRLYTLLDVNILNNTISDELVSSIAQILYTENSVIPQKKRTSSLQEELDQLSYNSNITNKKKNIIENYITNQSPSTPLSLPWYQKNWYELISLISNGDDSLSNDKEPEEIRLGTKKIEEYITYQEEFENKNIVIKKDTCSNIYGESVPLVNLQDMSFPWFDMFACWLKSVAKPKVTFDFKNAQWPILTDSMLQKNINKSESVTEPYTSNSTLDSIKDKESIIKSIWIQFSSKNYLLNEKTPNSLQPQLIIENKNTQTNLSITISSTWDNCTVIYGKNLCEYSYKTILKTPELILPLSVSNKTAGYSNIIIKICDNQTCSLQTYTLQVLPDIIDHIDIITPSSDLLMGSTVPIQIQAKDKYNNNVIFPLTSYTLHSSTGSFNGSDSIILSDFRTIQELQSPLSNWYFFTTLSIFDKNKTLVSSKKIFFMSWNLDITSPDNYYDNINKTIKYILPNKKSLIFVNRDYINIWLLPKLIINLENKIQKKSPTWPIIIQSENNMFDVYHINNFDKKIISTSQLEHTNMIMFNGEKQYIVLKPKWESGVDNLIINYPDWSEEKIAVSIKSALQASRVKITEELWEKNNNTIWTHSSKTLVLSIYDDRWNIVTTPNLIKNKTFWAILFSGKDSLTTLTSSSWNAKITITSEENWWMWYVISSLVTDNEYTIPWIRKKQIEQRIIPNKNINGLYLNVMWTDWWNDSETIANLFNTSEKLLWITTQLTDPSKIKTSILQILDNGSTRWSQINNRIIVKRWNAVVAQDIVAQQEILLWLVSDFERSNKLHDTTIDYVESDHIKTTFSWDSGSTNSKKVITLIDNNIVYSPDKLSSLEDSINPSNNIWWRHSQDHLTQFWQWKSIGEATQSNASEFLINYWDPLITRISENISISWTNFDDWPWQQILYDSTRTISKSLSIDINNDKLLDIVTIFTNGDVIRSKQYWQNQTFIPMWPLLKIFWTIRNVYGVDAQWDGFSDIIVEQEDRSVQIYTNNLWIFDVDWFPVCINNSLEKGNSVENIDQRFVNDMDKDGISDIIINQEWTIKIIYGSPSNNSYISNSHDLCDINWQIRQKKHTKIIESFSIKIWEWNIMDNSLLRRENLNQNNAEPAQDSNITDISSEIENKIQQSLESAIPNFSQLPLQDITAQATNNLMRWSISPTEYVPVYEQNSISENIRYITTSQLNDQDQVHVYKTYTDMNGWVLQKNDIVKVTVSILGLRNEKMTYIDRIQWPRIINRNSDGVISWRNHGTLWDASYIPITPQWGFSFIVDNIVLGAKNSVEFSYTVQYQWWSSIKIKVSDRNHDNYKDISVYPLDGCSQFLRTYNNNLSNFNKYRSYDKIFVNLKEKLETYSNIQQQENQNYISTITNTIQNISNTTGENKNIITNIMQDVWSEKMSLGNFLKNSLQEWWNSINLNITSIDNFSNEVNNKVKKTLDQICGNKVWWTSSCWSGLPIPFNMAFLSPWEFNIMGCKPKMKQIDSIFPQDSGFPIFAFPAALPLGPIVVPMPFPRWGIQKWPNDTYWYFWYPLQGPYDSVIRIYLSPTTTQQMWMAVCFWSKRIADKIPKVMAALWGNCIVKKIDLPQSSCRNTSNLSWDLSDEDFSDLSEFWSCTQQNNTTLQWKNLWTPVSPFKIVNIIDSNISSAFPPGTYFGIINIEKTPIIINENTNNQWITLQWGQELHPQVQWGMKKAKWLVACIMNDRLDRQTNYIINNFTNMQIGVYLPDVSQLGEWFETIGEQLTARENKTWYINNLTTVFEKSSNIKSSTIDTFSGNLIQKMRNYTINKSSLNELSNGINNPFEELAKMFEKTPLIRINSVDIAVNIPMIYTEDISKYEAYLKTRIKRNQDTIKDREVLLQWTLGLCWKNYNISWNWNSNVNPILDKKFFDELYNKLQQEKDQISEKINKKKSIYKERNICKEKKRNQDNDNCKKIMNIFSLDNKWLQDIESQLDMWEKINNQCISLLFNTSGWLNSTFKNLFSIIQASSTIETNIKRNIVTLGEYKNFPLQLYQWIHVVDRYLSEITTTVNNFLWSISLWLNTNATRFEQYVDAIITISSALETRQAILNLSTDRQKKCSTCTVDNYDAYACSLGFLCWQLKLPILKLPPFKIPNIYIDLSHIDVGMDISLPKFQFNPISIPLVDIPNLPQPPSIILNNENNTSLEKTFILLEKLNIGIKGQIPLWIPKIPLLPAPPSLPELPSFIPNINIELPVLPPAPTIPKIAPEIETIIKVVDFFSSLYCKVKWWIGLVWESNVKTKIEQLTQRTYEIPLFDNINLSKDMSYQQDKLQWFDFKIDAYVNFTINFNAIYSMIKWLAEAINEQTSIITKRKWDTIQPFSHIQDEISTLNDQTQTNITINNPLGFIKNSSESSIAKEQNNIKEIGNFLLQDSRTPIEKKQTIQWIINRIQKKATFIAQTQQIDTIQQQFKQYMDTSHNSLWSLQKSIQAYDTFLATLYREKNISYSVYSGQNLFVANLFKGNNDIIIYNDNNIMKDYIWVQKTLLSHYQKWLQQVQSNNNINTILKIQKDINYLNNGLTISNEIYSNVLHAPQKLVSLQHNYNAEEMLYYNNKAAVCDSLGNFQENNIVDHIAQRTTLNKSYPYFNATAQIGNNKLNTHTSSTSLSNLYDFSQYNKTIKVPVLNYSGNTIFTSVVTSEYFNQNNKWYELIDINNDKKEDIILRDAQKVWIKYWKQVSLNATITTTQQLYNATIWETPEQRSQQENGYIDIDDITIKVYSHDWSVKNLTVAAQNYDSFTLSWTNSERQQKTNGFLIEINKIPDLYHNKNHKDIPDSMHSRYVLFLPEAQYNTDWYLSINQQLTTNSLQKLLTWTLIDIVKYNPTNTTLYYSFTDIEKAWHYTRIASIQTNWDNKSPIYTLNSPWSHHVVAGPQTIADTQWPIPTIDLQRAKTKIIADSWLSPQWFVNTNYNIIVRWNDPNWVKENWIENSSGEVLSQLSWSNMILSGLYFTQHNLHRYTIVARDNNNNITREEILLTIQTPTLSIDDIINDNTPWKNINIFSSLTQGMDEWIVRFEKKRNNSWIPLSNIETNSWSNYLLNFDQTTIVWWLYNQSQHISFYDSYNNTIATINKDNGNIIILPNYINTIQKKINLINNIPMIILYDMVHDNNLFTITMKIKNTTLSSSNNYKLFTLSGSNYWDFAGGSCILSKENTCMVVSSPQWSIIIPSPYHTSLIGTYWYSWEKTIITFSLTTGEEIWTASFNGSL
jgi:hypothetical protein